MTRAEQLAADLIAANATLVNTTASLDAAKKKREGILAELLSELGVNGFILPKPAPKPPTPAMVRAANKTRIAQGEFAVQYNASDWAGLGKLGLACLLISPRDKSGAPVTPAALAAIRAASPNTKILCYKEATRINPAALYNDAIFQAAFGGKSGDKHPAVIAKDGVWGLNVVDPGHPEFLKLERIELNLIKAIGFDGIMYDDAEGFWYSGGGGLTLANHGRNAAGLVAQGKILRELWPEAVALTNGGGYMYEAGQYFTPEFIALFDGLMLESTFFTSLPTGQDAAWAGRKAQAEQYIKLVRGAGNVCVAVDYPGNEPARIQMLLGWCKANKIFMSITVGVDNTGRNNSVYFPTTMSALSAS